MKSLFVLGLVALAALGLWLVPQNRDDRITPRGPAPEPPRAVGTSGAHQGSAETEGGNVVTEIETIAGANDGMTLVGRRVDLHVDVQQRANDVAFWVGSPDNRVLVVIGRDNRTGLQRQKGDPSGHGISTVHDGQRAAISGVIRPVPAAEQRMSWNLTNADEKDLADRKIYIHADTVSSEGHGGRGRP
jgi:hypothetical protein